MTRATPALRISARRPGVGGNVAAPATRTSTCGGTISGAFGGGGGGGGGDASSHALPPGIRPAYHARRGRGPARRGRARRDQDAASARARLARAAASSRAWKKSLKNMRGAAAALARKARRPAPYTSRGTTA